MFWRLDWQVTSDASAQPVSTEAPVCTLIQPPSPPPASEDVDDGDKGGDDDVSVPVCFRGVPFPQSFTLVLSDFVLLRFRPL